MKTAINVPIGIAVLRISAWFVIAEYICNPPTQTNSPSRRIARYLSISPISALSIASRSTSIV